MSETKGMVNAYVCQSCGHTIRTINVDDGTTPFMIGCARCGEDAYSQMYNVPAMFKLSITHEWYRPEAGDIPEITKKECEQSNLMHLYNDALIKANLEHLQNGGLFLRKHERR